MNRRCVEKGVRIFHEKPATRSPATRPFERICSPLITFDIAPFSENPYNGFYQDISCLDYPNWTKSFKSPSHPINFPDHGFKYLFPEGCPWKIVERIFCFRLNKAAILVQKPGREY
jgi:hypothetical protein